MRIQGRTVRVPRKKKKLAKKVPLQFPKTKLSDMAWYKRLMNAMPELKPRWPLVATCCGGLRWVNAMYEDKPGGTDYCLDCQAPCHINFMTVDQWNSVYNKSGPPITFEEFKAKWDPYFGPGE